MSIQKELKDLLDNAVITEDVAERIHEYYQKDTPQQKQKLFIVFSVIGAILIALGIILLIAHNWDNLSRSFKTILALLPIIIGQIACTYSYFKKNRNPIWTEGSAIFLSISIGATLSLISQIYNIPGNVGTYIFTWAILGIPLIYLMQSRIAAVFSLLLIVGFAVNSGYWNNTELTELYTWPLLFSILPFYFNNLQSNRNGAFEYVFTWLLCLSLTIILGIHGRYYEEFLFLSYFLMFQSFYIIGNPTNTSYRYQRALSIIGIIGMNVILLTLSFKEVWMDIINQNIVLQKAVVSPEFIQFIIILILSILIKKRFQNKDISSKFNIYQWLEIPFLLIFILGYFLPISIYLINILVLVIGIFTIQAGIKKNSLGILNLGLFITSILIVFRFFDAEFSFISKGILFIVLGISFFLANYFMIQKKSDHVS